MKRIGRMLATVLAVAGLAAALCGCTDTTDITEPVKAEAVNTGPLEILFVNVNKADAILICSGDKSYLVDTGAEESAPQLVGALACMGVDSLDTVFVTHTHKDHLGGLVGVGTVVPIGRVCRAEFSENKANGGNKIDDTAAKIGVPATILSAGDMIDLPVGCLTVLGPLRYDARDDNDNSLVLQLYTNGKKVLLTGDMQFAEEDTLLKAKADLKADVLKVGNHGNPDATGSAFARAVAPAIAVISTDTSVDYDSANPRVYQTLKGAEIYSTEGTPMGILLRIGPDGAMDVSIPERRSAACSVSISRVSKEELMLWVLNDGPEPADLSGCMIMSARKGTLFRFPEGVVLQPGEEISVSDAGEGGTFSFTDLESAFSKKKEDSFLLYDRFGNLISD